MRTSYLPIELTIQHRGKPLNLLLWEHVADIEVVNRVPPTSWWGSLKQKFGVERNVVFSESICSVRHLEGQIVGDLPAGCEVGDNMYLIDSPELCGFFRILNKHGNIKSNGAYRLGNDCPAGRLPS